MPRSADIPPAVTVPASPEDVRRLAAHLRDACAAGDVDEMASLDCELALVEAANNIVEHGYAGRTGGDMTLAVATGDGAVRMELTDNGKPIPAGQFDRCRSVPLDAVEGRGTGIIQSCIDEITYTSSAGLNRLVLVKRIG